MSFEYRARRSLAATLAGYVWRTIKVFMIAAAAIGPAPPPPPPPVPPRVELRAETTTRPSSSKRR